MISTGIKNSILILLIIFIFHFFIKNVLLTKAETFVSWVDKKTSGECIKDVLADDKKNAKSQGGAEPNVEVLVDKPAVPKANEEEAANVYDAWFGSDPTNNPDADLDRYFAGEIDIAKEVEEATKCPIPVKDMSLPLSSTCDVNFDKLPADLTYKSVKANCNIVQDKKNAMMLNEYEDETDMNGGKLYMGLDAYDNSVAMFAPL